MEKINFPIIQRFYLDNRTNSHAFVESVRKILEVESTAHMFGRTFHFTGKMVQQYQSAKVDIAFEHPIDHQLLVKEFFAGNLVCIDYLVDIAEGTVEANNYFNNRDKVIVGKGILSSKYYYLEL